MTSVQVAQPELQDPDPGGLEIGAGRPDDPALVGLQRLGPASPVGRFQKQWVE
ncbi:hypothetical protein N9L90_01630 [Planctomycetota bacterium]|nr:hypothetical protein [Planctomycetota bacterium]